MHAPDTSTSPDLERDPEVLVELGEYRTYADGFDRGLVVLAIGRPFWLAPSPNGFRLLVEPPVDAEVYRQLACYDREIAAWRPQRPAPTASPPAVRSLSPLGWALLVLGGFWLQQASPIWVEAGALDARALFDGGEWWRLGTALFLHADGAHLIANGLSGIFVFMAVLATLGRGSGWLLLIVASLAGNFMVAALHYPDAYRSIGASTAVFAGLGLLTGRAVRGAWPTDRAERRKAILAPLVAGLTVLGLFGAGGEQVDVVAHATGFFAGLVLGFATATWRASERGRRQSSAQRNSGGE